MRNLTGRILIVDDERINLDFFDVMLSKLGFQVEKAADGEEALEKIVECSPDLVILDNIMPKLTGWEVTRRLKTEKEYRKYRTTPIIMFSAMNEVQDKIEGLELGVDDYITKPFNFSEVLARIRVVLRNRELAKQVTRRERRLAVSESLNSSLVFFTRHIRKPISALAESVSDVDPVDARAVKAFLRNARKEAKEILATLDGLEERIQELQSRGARLKRGDLSVEDLEDKYRKHLEGWKERREGERGDTDDI
jgi:DNA-binding response OmpR family regulator